MTAIPSRLICAVAAGAAIWVAWAPSAAEARGGLRVGSGARPGAAARHVGTVPRGYVRLAAVRPGIPPSRLGASRLGGIGFGPGYGPGQGGLARGYGSIGFGPGYGPGAGTTFGASPYGGGWLGALGARGGVGGFGAGPRATVGIRPSPVLPPVLHVLGGPVRSGAAQARGGAVVAESGHASRPGGVAAGPGAGPGPRIIEVGRR